MSSIHNPHIVPGEQSANSYHDQAYWQVKCPACQGVHERIVHTHWNEKEGKPIASHQIVCFEMKQAIFIESDSPFNVLRISDFGLVRDSKLSKDVDGIPF